MAKTRIGVVFGGRSAEHEVSLQSDKNIVDAIHRQRFDVVLLGIDKQWAGIFMMPLIIFCTVMIPPVSRYFNSTSFPYHPRHAG